jgi:hypothetical protein
MRPAGTIGVSAKGAGQFFLAAAAGGLLEKTALVPHITRRPDVRAGSPWDRGRFGREMEAEAETIGREV